MSACFVVGHRFTKRITEIHWLRDWIHNQVCNKMEGLCLKMSVACSFKPDLSGLNVKAEVYYTTVLFYLAVFGGKTFFIFVEFSGLSPVGEHDGRGNSCVDK